MADIVFTYNGKRVSPSSGKVLGKSGGDPYNPLGLPPFTIRCKFSSGYTPTMGDSQTLVDATDNVWDITKNSTDWSALFVSNSDLIEVMGANSTGVVNMEATFAVCPMTTVPLFDTSSVTTMHSTFAMCRNLVTVPLFDTSSVTIMQATFGDCTSLTTVPLFDTSSVTNMSSTFSNCRAVESGSFALYQQASTQTIPPTSHTYCFDNCGSNTATGQAELAQIPTSWGGTMA